MPATRRGWSIGIVVPARDEDERIGACLRSLRRAAARVDADHLRIVVVADGCVDRTAEVAGRSLTARDEIVTTAGANVGAARRTGTARVLELLERRDGADPRRTLLCNTDADSTVPDGWLASHLRLARAGAAAIAGIVHVDDFAQHPDHLGSRFARSYTLHPDGTHPHVHGTNLAVRADAYRDVGGWSAFPTAEDHDLWGRLVAAGWPTVSSIESWVTTSGRRVGRAPDGFAAHLGSLAAADDQVLS